MVRREGPQLSLIDLPGVNHNADRMENIHEAGLKPKLFALRFRVGCAGHCIAGSDAVESSRWFTGLSKYI